MTIRETIIGAVVARLAALPGLAETVEFMPAEPPSDFSRTIAVDDFGQSRDETDATHSRYTMTLNIEFWASGSSGAAAHANLMTLYADIVRAILAAPDRLGELAAGVVESIEEGDLTVDISAGATTRTLSGTVPIAIQFINRSHDPSLA